MSMTLYKVEDVVEFSQDAANKFFTKSYKKYLHLGAEFNDSPILISLDDIILIDEEETNEGREHPHTTLEWQRLANDIGNGIKPWLDLPIVVKNTDKDIKANYKLVAGYGTLNALKSNGVKKYWFWKVTSHTPSILSEIAVFENTSDVVTTTYKTGVDGIVYHLKNMIAKKHKALVNDEQAISDYIDSVWPGMIPEVKGVIISKAKNAQTKTRRIKTYNLSEVDNWLNEKADKTAQFVYGGRYDEKRKMYGFVSRNVIDPFINAAKKYAETGKPSYVVFHLPNPGKSQTIVDMRRTMLKKLQVFKKTFSDLGMKTDFLAVLGFLPQDKETDRMTLLQQ